MILTFFTMIVFIAEIIILIATITALLRLDRAICEINFFVIELKPKLENVVILVRKISEQLVALAPIWVENFNKAKETFIVEQIQKVLVTFIFWRINVKVIKRVRKSKLVKLISKGFNLLQNMI